MMPMIKGSDKIAKKGISNSRHNSRIIGSRNCQYNNDKQISCLNKEPWQVKLKRLQQKVVSTQKGQSTECCNCFYCSNINNHNINVIYK